VVQLEIIKGFGNELRDAISFEWGDSLRLG